MNKQKPIKMIRFNLGNEEDFVHKPPTNKAIRKAHRALVKRWVSLEKMTGGRVDELD